MARGKHRKTRRTKKIGVVAHRANGAGSRRFFTPFVWVAIVLGVFAISAAVKGISVTVEMEP